MQYLYSALSLISISALAVAQAQIPTCAQPCISNAVSAVTNCTQTDDACLCESANRYAIQGAATSCVISSCGTEAANVITVVSAACAAISSSAALSSSTTASSSPSSSASAIIVPPLASPTLSSSSTPESATIVPPLASTSVAASSTPATTTTPLTLSSTASTSASASATKNAAAIMGAPLTGALGLIAAVLGILGAGSG